MHIPDLMPLLRRGAGKTPATGGCLVQVASYLYDGKSWNDDTPCVHPILRDVAIGVNDHVSEDYRPKLAPLAADLVGTGPGPSNPTLAKILNVRLAVWACRRVQHLMVDQRSVAAVDAAEAWANCPCRMCRAAVNLVADAAAEAVMAARRPVPHVVGSERAATAARALASAAVNLVADAAPYSLVGSVAADATVAAGVYSVGYHQGLAAADVAAHNFLADLIAEHRRLTDFTPTSRDDARWTEVCELIGTTAGASP